VFLKQAADQTKSAADARSFTEKAGFRAAAEVAMFVKSFSTFSFKKVFYGIALGGLMLLGTGGAVQAANGPVCARRIARERFELNRAVARHGFYSGQANLDRRELARLRYDCGYRERWR
jgi:hypothetical protein